MKPILGIVVVIAIALFVVWKLGMSGFSPEEQANKLQNSIKPGMTWQQVLEIHEPGKFRAFALDASGFMIQGSAMKFTREEILPGIKAGKLPVGFAFEYFLSNEHHYRVNFDGQGNVSSPVERLATINDLLNAN